MTKPPGQITASEIVTALEGPCRLVDCVDKPNTCPRSAVCATRDIWTLLGGKMDEFLSGYTLDKLARMQDEKSGKDMAMYYI